MTETDHEYTIRPFETGDEQDFIDIFNETWSAEKTTDWVDWRYHDNPYVDYVPMYVAEYEGSVVATRPYKAFSVRSGSAERLAFLGTDTMTLPDHRRQGLFRRMTEAAMDDFSTRPDGERPAFFFSHSNQYSRPGYEQMGMCYVSEQVRYNRIQRVGSYVADAVDGVPGRVAGAVANLVNSGYLRWRDARADFDTDRFTVERHGTVPADTLTQCYEACRPAGVHVAFDRPFHEWHFAEPGNRPDATYVVHWDGHPFAGVVVGRTDDDRNDTSLVTIRHVVPAAGGPETTDAIAAAVEAILDDYADVEQLRTWNPLLPQSVRRAYGFLPDDRLPMSRLAEQGGLSLGFRPASEGAWTIDGRPIRSAASSLWTLA